MKTAETRSYAKALSVMLAVIFLLTLLPAVAHAEDDDCPSTRFTDVAGSESWYHPGVDFCLERGYMVGVSKTRFAPKERVTRAMAVTMLWKFDGIPQPAAQGFFCDVAADTWYSQAAQ